MAKIEKYGYKMTGIKNVCSLTRYINTAGDEKQGFPWGVKIWCTRDGGRIYGNWDTPWNNKKEDLWGANLVYVCKTVAPMTMQEVADMVHAAIAPMEG